MRLIQNSKRLTNHDNPDNVDNVPDIHIRNVDRSLLTAVNVESAKEEKTQRDWLIGVIAKAVGWEAGNGQRAEVRKDRDRGVHSREASERVVDAGGVREIVPGHNHKTCRVYGCLMCKLEGP